MPNVDVFAKVVSIDKDEVVVKSESLTENPTDTFRIKFSKFGSISAEKRMATVEKHGVGNNILLSGLRVPDYQASIKESEVLECNFAFAVDADIIRCQTGFVSLRGAYYSSTERGEDRLTEAAVWGSKAFRLGGQNHMSFSGYLDARATEIASAEKGSRLPHYGYMLRAEKDGVLIEYSRPSSSVHDVFPDKRDFSPITSEIHNRHVDSFIKSVVKQHGPDIQVSISPFTRYSVTNRKNTFTGKLFIDPNVKAHKSLALKTPKRSTFQESDRFGGHFAAKVNAAIVMSNDYKDPKTQKPIRRWVAERFGLSGAQVLTALIADSPYTNKALALHESLDDVSTRTKKAASGQNSESQSRLDRVSVSSQLDSPRETSAPSFAAKADESSLTKFSFVEAAMARDGSYVGVFKHPDGRLVEYSRGEIATRMNSYKAAGLDYKVYEDGWKMLDEIERYFSANPNPELNNAKEQSAKQVVNMTPTN